MSKKKYVVILNVLLISLLIIQIPNIAQASAKPQIETSSTSRSVYQNEPEVPQQNKTGPIPSAEVITRDSEKPPELTEITRSEVVLPVPAYLWRHGCGPTALGMVIGYYDGMGVDDLIPGDAASQTDSVNQMIASGGDSSTPNPPGSEEHHEDYASPEDSYPTLLDDAYITAGRPPHADNSLADYMDTSKSTRDNYYGWSWSNDVGPAFLDYVNQQNNSYLTSYQAYYSSSGTMTESVLLNEIDAGRPLVFLVDSNGDGGTDHFVPVIGYRYNPGLQYAVWDTWNTTVRWENFAPIASGVPWGIWGGWSFRLQENRTGAWLDALTFSIPDHDPFTAIKDGTIDIYDGGFINGYRDALADPDLAVETRNGSYNELTLNPAEFYDTNQLNPFSEPAIREALNYLIDRDYIAQVIYGDMAIPKFTPINTASSDYDRYKLKMNELESLYAYNPAQAQTTIDSEMETLGATLQGGKWYYNSEPVTLIFLIRIEDVRLQIGNYIADQLESIGFTVDRQYLSSSDAGSFWLNSDPAEGLWHIYTGGWIATAIPRDLGDNFQFFYTPEGLPYPLWQSYNPTPEFHDLCNLLADHTYSSMAERDTAFERALELALEDSVRVWLVDETTYTVRSANATAAYDLYRGLSTLYPYTARFLDAEGGDMAIGGYGLFEDVWNPISGSRWFFTNTAQSATEDHAMLNNPSNGLPMAQRIESAEVTAQTGLPIQDSSDWVTVNYESTIDVPPDAWTDWDALNQEFIPASETYPGGTSTRIKSVVTYPSDLFTTIKWHDGSPLSIGDFVLNMIMGVDRSKEDSPIYDETAYNFYYSGIKAIRITSENPLVIETYTDSWYLDAELNILSWWPDGGDGPAPWHTTSLAADVESDGLAAFSPDKSDAQSIPWMNYLTEPTKTYMNDALSTMTSDIPYANTLSAYITTEEAITRWTNLRNWYAAQGHFWVGNGPFYIDDYDWDAKTLHMTRFDDFPDEAGKWDEFSADPNPILEINYTEGEPGSFFTLTGSFYPPGSTTLLYLNTELITEIEVDSNGEFEVVLDTTAAETGNYRVMVKVNPAAVTSFVLVEDGDQHENENPEAPEIEVPEEIAENPPGDFTKTNPANAATDVSTSLILEWGTSSGVLSYEYCYDTTDDGACSGWTNNLASTSIALSGLDPGTTYYWQVRAWDGEAGPTCADGGETAFWSFTTAEEVITNEIYLPLILFNSP